MYRIDEECYVIYLGSEGHWVRPFLRIGTSRYFPDWLKRHIGSVVITDHLTGDFFYEADCLDARSVKGTRYVGTQKLVSAVKRFVHREQITYQALEPVETDAPPKGGQVRFFEDGNIRVFLDGHRLFDLNDRERLDRHTTYRLRRLNDIVSATRGVYRQDDLQGSGFILDSDGSVLIVGDGAAYIERTAATHSLGRWALWGVPLDCIRGIGGEAGWPALRELYKYRLATEQQITSIAPKRAEESDAIHVFDTAGIKEERRRVPTFPGQGPIPRPRNARSNAFENTPPVELYLADGARWAFDTEPPVLPGVLYTYEDHQSDIGFRHLLTNEIRDELDAAGSESDATNRILHAVATRRDISPIDRVCAALSLWNRRSAPGYADADADLRDLVESTFAEQHIPVIAIFRGDNDDWRLRFRLRDGTTRSAIADNNRARDRIAPLLRASHEAKLFSDERERLLTFLRELLEAHRQAEEVAKRKEKRKLHENAHHSIANDDKEMSEDASPTTPSSPSSPSSVSRSAAGRSRREIGAVDGGRRIPIIPIGLVVLLVGAVTFWFFRRPPRSDAPEAIAAIKQPEADTGTDAVSADDAAPVTGVETDNEFTPSESTARSETRRDNPEWSNPEILRVTNWIAVDNGYHPVGVDNDRYLDPDWIFPGNTCILPDGTTRIVARGDTLWSIAEAFLTETFLASQMELSRFRDLIEKKEFAVDELEDNKVN